MKLHRIQKSSPQWAVFDEIGGPVTFHATPDLAHANAKERGAGRTIIYVAQILLTNDSAQWARDHAAAPAKKTKRST